MNEEWRPIEGTTYRVSTWGRIQNRHGRVLRPRVQTAGHIAVGLSEAGIARDRLVSRVVHEAFIGPIPAGHRIVHRDGNPANNRTDNLESRPWGRTTHNRPPVLSDEDRAAIRRLKGRETARAVAGHFGVSAAWVSQLWQVAA